MKQKFTSIVLCSFLASCRVSGQDYEVADISCSFREGEDGQVIESPANGDRLTAKLRKPDGFRGAPIFADARQVDAATSDSCRISRDPADPDGLIYNLEITDLQQCGVLRKNGFVNVRIWFPRLPGVVMMSDQEVIIMCKPAESVVTRNKAAGFAGQLPPAARVSGVVEESPGNLEYEVALFRQAGDGGSGNGVLDNEIPVEQAVPIGTKLQLRATINDNSAWRFVKLTEVTISSDPKDAYAPGHIKLVDNGCRVEEFTTIVPRQPYHSTTSSREVRMEFEAVLLDAQRDRANQLWIHARIKACVVEEDCEPELCLDLYQPVGAGKRRRRRGLSENPYAGKGAAEIYLVRKEGLVKREDRRNFFPVDKKLNRGEKHGGSTDFGDNVGVTVILPGEEYFSGVRAESDRPGSGSIRSSPSKLGSSSSPSTSFSATSSALSDCSTFLIVGAVLGSLLVVASVMMCILSQRLYKISRRYNKEKLDDLVREHRRKFGRQTTSSALPGNEASTTGGGGGGGLFRMTPAPSRHVGMAGGSGDGGSRLRS